MKSLLKRLGLSLFALVAFLGMAELAARLKYHPARIVYRDIFEYDKDKVYRLKRSFTGQFEHHVVKTNARGYRDDEIATGKPRNGVRILMLGDSITFGHGVDARDTFSECLERRFNRRTIGFRYEVINTACPGNSPFQEYYDLVRGLPLQPDAVVLQFTLNDVLEPYVVYRRYGGKGRDYHGVEDIPYYHYLLSQHCAFYLFLKDLYARIYLRTAAAENLKTEAVGREIYKVKNLVYQPDHPQIREAWEECFRWLQRMVDTCRQENVPLVMLVTPFDFQISLPPDMDIPQHRVAEFAERNALPRVDLLQQLRAEQKPWGAYFLDYDHLNPAGHDWVADLLYPALEQVLKQKK